jgi:ubiquinone/menaquinone biosynthesis C-methylase UbiE
MRRRPVPMRRRISLRRIRVSSIVFANTFPIGPAVMSSIWDADREIFPIRFLRSFPDARVTAVDASRPMLDLAAEAIARSGLANRITLCCERFQSLNLPEQADALLSNSLLHHVPNPLQFWFRLKQLAKPGACVLVMDLLRPDSPEAAQALVDQYAGNEDPILKRDFYNSLLAAFTEDDVAAQLAEMNLSRLLIDVPDDRHWVVGGILL